MAKGTRGNGAASKMDTTGHRSLCAHDVENGVALWEAYKVLVSRPGLQSASDKNCGKK
jgi:hypothetical protein